MPGLNITIRHYKILALSYSIALDEAYSPRRPACARGQAFGAGEFELVGVLLQRCLLIVTLLCAPIFFLWYFATGPILVVLGANAETIQLAVLYCRVYYFYLWPTLVYRALTSFLQCQGIVRPATAVIGVGTAVSIPMTWYAVEAHGFLGTVT